LAISAEIAALGGVALGAILSFAASYMAERASWRRSQGVRWDERRLAAYADYSHAVKDQVALAGRIAAGRGFDSGVEPLNPSQENLALLAEAEARRTAVGETVRLLADSETLRAAREMTLYARKLDWLVRGRPEVEGEDWKLAYLKYAEARDHYITCARKSLRVTSVYIPDSQGPNFRQRLAGGARATTIPESLVRLSYLDGEDLRPGDVCGSVHRASARRPTA
jgi:hypothetical protein